LGVLVFSRADEVNMKKTFSSIIIAATLANGPLMGGRYYQSDVEPAIAPVQMAIPQIQSPLTPRGSLHTEWDEGYGRDISRQNRFNQHIERAVKEWKDLDPLILKSLLAQESGFRTDRRNRYGYTGVAQIGYREAVEAGLVVTDGCDQRYTPYYAIPAAARILRRKARHLYQEGFSKYGMPDQDDYWKFIAAAYNAGEGTIVNAMRKAYGDRRPDKVRFDDLVFTATGNPWDSPLMHAMPRKWRRVSKYKEIKEYAISVVARARQG